MNEKVFEKIISFTEEVEETSQAGIDPVVDNESVEVLLNRILEQLHYMDENDSARIDALEEKLSNIENTLSQNSIDDEIDASPSSEPGAASVSANDIHLLLNGLSDLTSETVSQNDLTNESIMTKHLDKYNTFESLLLCIVILFFGLFTVHIFKE